MLRDFFESARRNINTHTLISSTLTFKQIQRTLLVRHVIFILLLHFFRFSVVKCLCVLSTVWFRICDGYDVCMPSIVYCIYSCGAHSPIWFSCFFFSLFFSSLVMFDFRAVYVFVRNFYSLHLLIRVPVHVYSSAMFITYKIKCFFYFFSFSFGIPSDPQIRSYIILSGWIFFILYCWVVHTYIYKCEKNYGTNKNT